MPHHMRTKKYKLEQEEDTSTYLLEWTMCRTLKPLNAGEIMEQQEFSFTAGGTAKWSHSEKNNQVLKNNLAVSYRAKHTLTIVFSNRVPWSFTQRS